ncbi:MAG: hypothetical protein EZS28_056155 [Streblomastix strix]|uniref:Protein kinase domain-containing protein n=1 Tax=Streblomastix strix TaxID=222440 RepID=A0A5J4PPZ6_9EUKA|nr:MAG: hypothetical protein EZS28_056155 [Streblomastix strix]
MAVDKLEPRVQSNPIYIGETIGQKYVVERMLAAGKSSTVFIAHAKHDTRKERVALEVAPIENGQTDLDNDITVLKSIEGILRQDNWIWIAQAIQISCYGITGAISQV